MSTGPAIRTSRSHSSSSSLDGGLAVILPGEVAVVVIVGVAAMSALLIRPHSIELRLLVTSADVRASPVITNKFVLRSVAEPDPPILELKPLQNRIMTQKGVEIFEKLVTLI